MDDKTKNILISKCFGNIHDAIEFAAEYLPEYYNVKISVEKGGYDVELESPNGELFGGMDGGDGMRSDVHLAVCLANGFDLSGEEVDGYE